MLRGFCALATSKGLKVCAAKTQRNQKNAPRKKQQQQQRNRRQGNGQNWRSKGQSSPPAQRQNKKRGMAVLWTTNNLSLLRAWWCADRRHQREPRCARGVRWTRQQPGLSAMRRLYCATQNADVVSARPAADKTDATDANGTSASSSGGGGRSSVGGATARLCKGAGSSPRGTAVYESDPVYGTTVPSQLMSGGGIAGAGGSSRRNRPIVRQSTIIKIMLGLLLLATVFGWRMRHLLTRSSKPAEKADGAAPFVVHPGGGVSTAPFAVGTAIDQAVQDCEEGVVSGGGQAARRRARLHSSKRARA